MPGYQFNHAGAYSRRGAHKKNSSVRKTSMDGILRRNDPIPRREEHQLGGRLSRTGIGALARSGTAAQRDQRCLSAEDSATTLVAAAGEPDIKEKLLRGYDAAGKNFRVHLDGYDQRDFLASKGPDKRREFFYWTDDGNLNGLRYDQWKAVFMEQRAEGLNVWAEPLVQLRLPRVFNLRSDPFERAQHESGDYVRWFIDQPSCSSPRRRSWRSTLRASANSRRDNGPAHFQSSRQWKS